MDEKQAIQCLKRGDIGGLEFLVNRFQTKAIHVAYLITRDLGLAEDVVQEAFINAFHSIRSFDARRPFEPWLLQSVVRAAVRVAQRSARQVEIREAEEGTLFTELIARTESVEEQIEFNEIRDQIWEAMQRLSPRQRAVVIQRYFLEMNEKDMATESGTAIGTIKWLLNAARQRLRTLLAGRSDG